VSFIPLEQYPDLQALAGGHPTFVSEIPTAAKWIHWLSDAQDPSGHCAFLDGEWTVFPIYMRGDRPWRAEFVIPGADARALESLDRFFRSLPSRFPAATALLSQSRRVRYAAFSRLHARSSIDRHRHYNDETRILHVALVVPPDGSAGLEVDGHTRIWSRPGDAALWNDNLVHRAWNDSDQDRIILYVAAELDEQPAARRDQPRSSA
jgi:Aspartyl/Asparaginyl beta-hydroxylase